MNRVGIDLVEIGAVERSLVEFGGRFLLRVFTAAEVDECDGDVRRLAARLAAKEAVIKALRPGPDDPMPPRQIEVVSTTRGPEVRLHGIVAENARGQRWHHVSVSLSHNDCHAAAVVVVTVAA